MKKFFKMLLVALIAFVSMANVNAVYDSIYFDDERLVGVNQIKGVGTTYKTVYEYKNGQKGKYLGIGYCFNKSLNAPPDGKLDAAPEGFLPNDEKTNMYIYILDNGYGGSWNTSVIGTGTFSNHEKYYITQVALWIAQGSVNADTIKNSGTLGKAAYNLYSAASKNKTVVAYTPEVILNGNTSMKLSGDKYVSETITLTVKGTDKATVNIVNAPAGSKIVADGKEYNTGVQFKSGTKFTVTVPADKIVQSHTLKVTANTSAIRKKVQIYRYDNNLTYQNIGLIFQEPYKANTELKLNIVPTGKLVVTKVEIVDGKEVNLKGATLVLKDSKGKEIAKWTTDNENPKTISGLTIGETYTLSELIAPNGYKKIADKKVTIKSSVTQQVTVVDEKIEDIYISKQDVTNKEELPGAHLVVKDSKGNVIDEWTSTDTPHKINKELAPGEYTLTETIAPEGYILSKETVKFTVDANGRVAEKVVMYNTPKKDIFISKQDITNKEELPGAHLVIKDSEGNVVEEWTSTDTPHKVTKKLAAGEYTLTETIAPEGYELSTETVKFIVDENGEVAETVVMYNTPKKGVYISKQDVTNKEELPGAHLVVKDSEGKVVAEWVSTDKPHYLVLKEGKYTLTETIAPEGYLLTEETIEFEIKADGKPAATVIMYNEPIPETTGTNMTKIILSLVGTLGLGIFCFAKIRKQQA